jgi:large subunit ribosomal protein L3
MKFILGTKQNMTQLFDEEGKVHPVTVVKAEDLVVTQVKTKLKDGYEAIQVGFGTKKEKTLTKHKKVI